jgi:hypothetical protein
MPVSLKYRYTTGPISGSEFQDNIRVVVLNNGTKQHTARIKIFNLDVTPKTRVYDETFTVMPQSQIGTGYIPSFELWEVQVHTDSSVVQSGVWGRSGFANLEGNTVLNKEMTKF